MFTLNGIREAHSKVKSGADYPAYVQEIIKMGVAGYETHVKDGKTVYFGTNNYRMESGPKYDQLIINNEPDAETFKKDLKLHQNGKTNFTTFCNDAARSGVEKWVVNLNHMSCTYLDNNGNVLVVESIPTGNK